MGKQKIKISLAELHSKMEAQVQDAVAANTDEVGACEISDALGNIHCVTTTKNTCAAMKGNWVGGDCI